MRTRTGRRVAPRSAATSVAAAAPWRPGAVTITSARSLPSARARSANRRQTFAAPATDSAASDPVHAISAPRPRYALSLFTVSSAPFRADLGHEQAHGVRADVEDGDEHARILVRSSDGGAARACCAQERARRARTWARRIIASW